MCSIFCTTYNLFPSVLYNIPFSSPTSSATSVHASYLFQFFSESRATFILKNQILRNALCAFFIRCHCGGRHFGLNSNRKGMERVFFILRLRLRLHLHLRWGSLHVCLLVLPLAFAFATLVWTSLKGCNIEKVSLYCYNYFVISCIVISYFRSSYTYGRCIESYVFT